MKNKITWLVIGCLMLALAGIAQAENAPSLQSVRFVFTANGQVVGAGAAQHAYAEPSANAIVILPSEAPVLIAQHGEVQHLFLPSENPICVAIDVADLSVLPNDKMPGDLAEVMDARVAGELGTVSGDWSYSTEIVGMTPDTPESECEVPVVTTFAVTVTGYANQNIGATQFTPAQALWQTGSFFTLSPLIQRVGVATNTRLLAVAGVTVTADTQDATNAGAMWESCFDVPSATTLLTFDQALRVPLTYSYIELSHESGLPVAANANSCPAATVPSFVLAAAAASTPEATPEATAQP